MWPDLPAPPESPPGRRWPAPGEAQCLAWWDRFEMPEHIRAHSRKVAQVSVFVAEAGRRRGLPVCVETVLASALLHDLAKIYCITHGGNHSQLGGAWAMALTRNPLLAQGVTHHVYWPFAVDVERFFVPLAVLYGDKRVSHDRIVPIEDRFDDLLERYGKTPDIRERIHSTNRQAKDIESALSRLLEIDLNAHDFDRGRLVE
ncbi:MAG: phosphohydrolase [Proteobacteria bacterium]|nr:phosphohydrolase [Pseudomonadota bacterium]MBU1595501.1 phosphohydrolase [Pseudomonadota bacterium]